MIPSNDAAPHRIVAFIKLEVHELLPTGECSGRPVHKIEQFPIWFDGADRAIAIRKANEFVQEMKAKCP